MRKKLMVLALASLTGAILFSAACGTAVTSDSASDSGNEKVVQVVPERFRRKADYSDRKGVKREWDQVSSYFCNYGPFQEAMLDYDVAIIGRDAMSDEEMKKFADAGVWTIAYITLGEDYSLNVGDGLGPGGYASYYLYDSDDKPIPNGDWGSYYTDPGNPAWQQIVINEVQRLVDAGNDGIFMDTVDSVDRFPETFNAMCDLILRIREEFPDLKMVLNRGFTVVPTLYEALDGVMFELFSTYYNLDIFKYDVLDQSSVQFMYNRSAGVSIVNAVRQKKYFPVFGLEYYPRDGFAADKQIIYDTDWEFDFIPYLTMEGRELGGEITDYNLRPKSERGKRALSLRDEVEGLEQNGDTSAKNLLYLDNGAAIKVDSSFNGYGKEPLNDGYVANADNFDLIGFQWANWASAENGGDHWVEMELKDVVAAKKLVVDWAFDNGSVYSSRRVRVEAFIGGAWVEAGKLEDIENETVRSEIALNVSSPTNRYRLVQPAGYGPTARRNLMWISELSLYAE